MNIFFISAECYPMAKVGGLADVVGALPKYLNKFDADVSVVIPKYDLPWFEGKNMAIVYQDTIHFAFEEVHFSVLQYISKDLGYTFYAIDIPGKLDRKGVYADENGYFFEDETERLISFQRAYLQWVNHLGQKPDIIHCHDHHTGLIPFMMQHAYEFEGLKNIPTVFSIHNERYQGAFSWNKKYLLPDYAESQSGLLDWGGMINPLACAVKCSWKVNTVSPTYMKELQEQSFGLEWLFQNEKEKSQGILNGIDTKVWDPKSDTYLFAKLVKSPSHFKSRNKMHLIKKYGLKRDKALISYIGRFAYEKGADLLPNAIETYLNKSDDAVFIILGTGDPEVEKAFKNLSKKHPRQVAALVTYDEKVSHEIYAGSDFLIMPSRVEPCGLNQMYAMRYGSIPIVRNIGGLKDSVTNIKNKKGTGIKFEEATHEDILKALDEAVALYHEKNTFEKIKISIFKQDFSWEQSAQKYLNIYHELTQ